jgi:hypothetical protein
VPVRRGTTVGCFKVLHDMIRGPAQRAHAPSQRQMTPIQSVRPRAGRAYWLLLDRFCSVFVGRHHACTSSRTDRVLHLVSCALASSPPPSSSDIVVATVARRARRTWWDPIRRRSQRGRWRGARSDWMPARSKHLRTRWYCTCLQPVWHGRPGRREPGIRHSGRARAHPPEIKQIPRSIASSAIMHPVPAGTQDDVMHANVHELAARRRLFPVVLGMWTWVYRCTPNNCPRKNTKVYVYT